LNQREVLPNRFTVYRVRPLRHLSEIYLKYKKNNINTKKNKCKFKYSNKFVLVLIQKIIYTKIKRLTENFINSGIIKL
jgi:hypothetical protein